MAKKKFLVRVNSGISWTGMKPWYCAYVHEKFEVFDNSISDFKLSDTTWAEKNIGTQTAYIEKRHCTVVKEIIERFSPVVLAEKASGMAPVDKFKARYQKSVSDQTQKSPMMDVVNKMVEEGTKHIQELTDKVMEPDGSPKVDLTKKPTHFSSLLRRMDDEPVDDPRENCPWKCDGNNPDCLCLKKSIEKIEKEHKAYEETNKQEKVGTPEAETIGDLSKKPVPNLPKPREDRTVARIKSDITKHFPEFSPDRPWWLDYLGEQINIIPKNYKDVWVDHKEWIEEHYGQTDRYTLKIPKDYVEVIYQPDQPKAKKPPIGVVPRYIHEEQRCKELKAGIERYLQQWKEVPAEWIEEYNELVTRIAERQNKAALK